MRSSSFGGLGRLATLLLLAAASLAPATARAGGFAATRFGGEHGHPATDDPTAIYYNPAGLAYGHGTRIQVEGLFVYRTVDYDRDPDAIDDASASAADIAANSGHGSLANVIISPFAGVATDFGIEGIGAGIGFYAPFGGQTSWDKSTAFENNSTYPGAVDGPARWSAIEGEQRSIYISAGGAWRTKTGKFGIGAALNVISSSLALVRARNLDGTDDLTDTGAVKEGRALLDLKDLTFSASIGLMFKPTECSRIGISYQSQPGFGEMTLDGTLTNKYGAATPFDVPVQMRQQLPDSIRVGGTWRAFTKGTLHFAADYQRWSVFKDQCLVQTGLAGGAECKFKAYEGAGDAPIGYRGALDTDNGGINVLVNIARDWHDTFSVRGGGTYEVSDKLELNAGVLFDTNAVPDETLEPALIDTNKLIGQLGARFGVSSKLQLTGTLGYVAYFSRTTTPRPDELDLPVPNRNPDMAGTFKSMVAYVLIGVGVQL